MELAITALFCVIIILLIAINFLIHNNREGKLIDNIPGPKYYPILGNAFELQLSCEDIWKILRKWSDDYYPIYRFWICHWPVVNLRHPDDAEVYLSCQKNITKSLFYDFLHPWLNKGLLTSTGQKWRNRRKTLTPAFHFNVLQEFVPIFTENVERMIKILKEEGDEVVKDLVPFLATFTLNDICETAMGTKLQMDHPKQDKYRRAVKFIGDVLYYRVVKPWLKNDWVFSLTQKGKEHTESLKILHDFTTNIIKERKQYHDDTESKYLKKFASPDGIMSNSDVPEQEFPIKKKRLAMLDLLIAAQRHRNEIDDAGIREEVDTFVFEGHDTTNMGMTFSLLLLGEHKEIQEHARVEIDAVLKESNGKLGLTELQSLTYLDRCIKESLRLFPSVPSISRYMSEDMQLKNYLLPRGTIVNLHIMDLHRDPNFWPQPDVFDPDRFLPDRLEGRHPFSYIPFSGGPRNCIGQKFAMLELKATLALILHNFYLESQQPVEKIQIVSDLVLKTKDPVYLKFTAIQR